MSHTAPRKEKTLTLCAWRTPPSTCAFSLQTKDPQNSSLTQTFSSSRVSLCYHWPHKSASHCSYCWSQLRFLSLSLIFHNSFVTASQFYLTLICCILLPFPLSHLPCHLLPSHLSPGHLWNLQKLVLLRILSASIQTTHTSQTFFFFGSTSLPLYFQLFVIQRSQ